MCIRDRHMLVWDVHDLSNHQFCGTTVLYKLQQSQHSQSPVLKHSVQNFFIISGVVALFEHPLWGSSSMLTQPYLNPNPHIQTTVLKVHLPTHLPFHWEFPLLLHIFNRLRSQHNEWFCLFFKTCVTNIVWGQSEKFLSSTIGGSLSLIHI